MEDNDNVNRIVFEEIFLLNKLFFGLFINY